MAGLLQILYITGWIALLLVSLRTHRRPFPLFSIAAAVQAAQSLIMLTGDPTDNHWVTTIWWPSRIILCLSLAAAVFETCHVITARMPLGRRTIARSAAIWSGVFLLIGLGHRDLRQTFASAIWVAMAAGITIITIACCLDIPRDILNPDRRTFWWNAGLLTVILTAHVLISVARPWYAAQAAFRITCIAACSTWCYLSLRCTNHLQWYVEDASLKHIADRRWQLANAQNPAEMPRSRA